MVSSLNGYLVLKHLHIAAVSISAMGFVLRGYWMLNDSPLLQHKLSKRLPHVVDTVLLASAVALLVMGHGSFLSQPWLQAKLAGLMAYIVLGSVALKRGSTRRTRTAAFMAAVLCLVWMASVAVLKSPAGFLAGLTQGL